jgi:multidrug efflux pump
VQNRLSRATPRLPSSVTQQGVRVDKARSNFLLFVSLTSSNPAYDPVALGDYAARNIQPELLRIPGVGQAQLFGTERAMRVWIDPVKLQSYNLSPADVTAAIRAQNAQVSAGTIGDAAQPARPDDVSPPWWSTASSPAPSSSAPSRCAPTPTARPCCLRDVARMELGAQAYASRSRA